MAAFLLHKNIQIYGKKRNLHIAARLSGLLCTIGLPGPFEVDCAPRMHMTVHLSKEKFSRQRSQLMTRWYDADLFSARREASLP